MTKKFSLFAAAISLATASMFSVPGQVAADEWNNPTSIAPGTVEVAFIEVSAGGVYVSFTTSPFVTTCGHNGLWWRVGSMATPTTPAMPADTVNKLLSVLMAAKLSDTKLKVLRLNSACGPDGYPVITGLMLG